MKFKAVLNTKKRGIILLISIIVFCFLYIQALYSFPDELLIINGEDYVLDAKNIIPIRFMQDKEVDLKINKNKSTFVLRSEKGEKINLNVNMLGVIPLKSIAVQAVPRISLIPCGNTVGIKIYTKGPLVVGESEVTGEDGKQHKPYKDADIKMGDYFFEINNTPITSIKDITKIMSEFSDGRILNIKLNRNGNVIERNITPIKSYGEDKYRMGLWLRDSTVGIGTMTFYDDTTNIFGALGHGISDIDTGTLMDVSKGEILKSDIVSANKGYRGSPGELKGVFIENINQLGKVIRNTDAGIYGTIQYRDEVIPENESMPIALKSEIKEGRAKILCNIDGDKVEAYDIIIQRVFKQTTNTSKSMVIKVIDKRLLDITGGIVQGMSGSPIIQNDKLVGAVTHVLVNDPTRGYGIFIENMIDKRNLLLQAFDD